MNAKKVMQEIDDPEKIRVTLYVERTVYEAVRDAVGSRVSRATESMWRDFLKALKEPK